MQVMKKGPRSGKSSRHERGSGTSVDKCGGGDVRDGDGEQMALVAGRGKGLDGWVSQLNRRSGECEAHDFGEVSNRSRGLGCQRGGRGWGARSPMVWAKWCLGVRGVGDGLGQLQQ
jgi:hypothetical protein